jgi:hypothetical protein
MESTHRRKAFPWPLPHGQIWVETWSVFDKDKLSTRELTSKEEGKLLDLRPEWYQYIAEVVCNWNTSLTPICLLAEVGISGTQWILMSFICASVINHDVTKVSGQ